MDENATQQSLEIQKRLQRRLEELGYADPAGIARISRLLAEIAVLGQGFAQNSLPLFLAIDRENWKVLGALGSSFQVDLEQMMDAISDVRQDLCELVEYLQHQ